MATPEQERQVRDNLQDFLTKLAAIIPEDLVRKSELGTQLSFENGLPYFRRNLDLFRRLLNQTLDSIPYSAITTINAQAQQQLAFFTQIKEFSLSKYPQNAVANRDSFISQIRDSYDGLFNVIMPILSYISDQSRDFSKLEIEARNVLSSLQVIKNDIEETKQTQLAELDSILERVRKAAAEVGVSQHAINFSKEAEYHKTKGIHWLFATVALTAINFAYALVIAFYYSDVLTRSMTTSQIIQGSVSKLIAFSILSFGMLWCSRSYRAHRNGHIVNRHRQNALTTFETFVKATNDDQTKNAVLLQAAQSIFIPQNTGYLSSENEQVQSTKILEVIRSVIAKE